MKYILNCLAWLWNGILVFLKIRKLPTIKKDRRPCFANVKVASTGSIAVFQPWIYCGIYYDYETPPSAINPEELHCAIVIIDRYVGNERFFALPYYTPNFDGFGQANVTLLMSAHPNNVNELTPCALMTKTDAVRLGMIKQTNEETA